MNSLVPIVLKLQDILRTISHNGFVLPTIAVVGSQSAGKSSVLEAIIGRDLLPRGAGIVTRRPLVLHLINSSENPESKSEEYAEFDHVPNRKFAFADVRAEIIAETERSLGKTASIGIEPIRLKLYSPNVVTLTLVDLPGLTKNPVGNQPADIEEQIRDLVLSYVTHESSIILAVSSGNTDICNSEALKLARQVDPDGLRTISVITKLDLTDDVSSVLSNMEYPLAMGHVGLVLRSNQDAQDGVSVSASLSKEISFFSKSQVYKSFKNIGTSYLVKLLNTILMQRIKDALPNFRHRLHSALIASKDELELYGPSIQVESETSLKGALLLNLVAKFVSNFRDAVDGKLQEVYGGQLTELYGGSRISYTFHELFGCAIDAINPFDTLSDDDIRTAIRNATGPRPSLFVPEIAFDLLVKRQIVRLEEPALQCCELIFDELLSVANQCDAPEFSRFTIVREKIIEQVYVCIRNRLGPARDMISNLIAIELAYVNTSHPDFVGGSNTISALKDSQEKDEYDFEQFKPIFNESFKSLRLDVSKVDEPVVYKLPAQVPPVKPRAIPTDREVIETAIIKSLITSYFNIVKKSIRDSVPKAIMCFLVNASMNNLQSELVSSLYKESDFNWLLSESDEMTNKRVRARENIDALQKALELTNEIRDVSIGKL